MKKEKIEMSMLRLQFPSPIVPGELSRELALAISEGHQKVVLCFLECTEIEYSVMSGLVAECWDFLKAGGQIRVVASGRVGRVLKNFLFQLRSSTFFKTLPAAVESFEQAAAQG